ncbi:crotonobetainyl-CoA:carnitine CoA-transferase CaiB-like acyl-CoA transferase [Altererythrobacter atlanticus]|uniref:Formyl-coenzyme A transferase n=1 Tax=Croceibacterium atlanticum TaxID=1267766 RepID=A0A0F7KVK1_9SPHN|nr:CoA transferase [Croceibacterium atlanticum]AKH44353.1 Formyl-coenzyme A transferase [Croceibacterium atlanticum]MBB5733930.1 crotonobetainyl-CoA:carnitine CoA-transferase CaiB-like acyl-CoA transferase [Croceibacterium atlanticum]
MAEKMAGALDGIRVLDFTAVMAGPYATRMLADLGAEVIKVEAMNGGDQVRARPPLRDGKSRYFAQLNAGKRSLACDLKNPEMQATIRALVGECDIVVENFRPGVMARFGLDHETLLKINPRLIYCSISGYGQKGPKAHSPAYAPVIHASSGFDLSNLEYQDGSDKPANGGIFIADVLGGTHAFGAIQTALFQRERNGRGQFIDVSMLEAMVGMLVYETQVAQQPLDERRPLYKPLRTEDGFIMVAPTSPANFLSLIKAMERPELAQDPRFVTNVDRNRNWDALLAEAEAWTIRHSSQEAEAILSAQGVPCAVYRTVEEVMEDDQLAARNAFTTIDDGAGPFKVTNPPFQMTASAAHARPRVAALGEDGADIMRQILKMRDEEIETYRKNGLML